MRETWVSCRQTKRRPLGRGFTLLELLLVLLLLALLSGLVLPRLSSWLTGAEERAWRSTLRETLEHLPFDAYRRGESMEVDVAALRERVPNLPTEVRLELSGPLRYAANGLASGALLRVQAPGRAEQRWYIKAMTGEVRIEEAPIR